MIKGGSFDLWGEQVLANESVRLRETFRRTDVDERRPADGDHAQARTLSNQRGK